ncbi:hypothetical protein [Kitasatospora aureofaciens]|uniref:hypothetical protein n=1 Tax=Kitasatospora aureofaciens TaxID=1894 RepID=UPI0037CADF9B
MRSLLTLYQLLRRTMVEAAESRPGTNPDRCGFTIPFQSARDLLIRAEGVTEQRLGEIDHRLPSALLPARRLRVSTRKVKSPVTLSWFHGDGSTPPTCTGDQPSFHLTFALRERTPLDLAHELIASALDCESFREGLAPARLRTENLGDTLNEVREMITSYLGGLDLDRLVDRVADELGSES